MSSRYAKYWKDLEAEGGSDKYEGGNYCGGSPHERRASSPRRRLSKEHRYAGSAEKKTKPRTRRSAQQFFNVEPARGGTCGGLNDMGARTYEEGGRHHESYMGARTYEGAGKHHESHMGARTYEGAGRHHESDMGARTYEGAGRHHESDMGARSYRSPYRGGY